MSLICLCITNIYGTDRTMYKHCLAEIVKKYKRGVLFHIDWTEPIIEGLKEEFSFFLTDSPNCIDCEMLLLPDKWCYGGNSNNSTFQQRMQFLQDIADILIKNSYQIEYYIGLSGTYPSEFQEVSVKCQYLTEYLTNTIGQTGADDGIHIIVIP